MGMLPRELSVAQEGISKPLAAEEGLQSLAESFPPSVTQRINEGVAGGIIDRKAPDEAHGLNKNWTENKPSRSKKPAFFFSAVLGLLLAGFLAKEFWLDSTGKLGIEASPPLSVPKGPSIPPKQESRIKSIITVEKGETISSLAKRHYGLSNHTLLDHILIQNQDITNLHLIREHQKIRLPEIVEDSLITQTGDGTYEIWLGTFSEPEQAGYLKREFSLGGRAIELLPRKVSSDEIWYRAVAGNFETREECLKSIQRLRDQRLLPAFRE